MYSNGEDTAEPSVYIKVQDIGIGISETPLIVASYFFKKIFEQASRNLALSQIAKLVDLVV